MRIKPLEHRANIYLVFLIEIFSVLIITYTFLSSLQFDHKILVVLLITLLMSLYGAICTEISYQNKKRGEQDWLYELTRRIAFANYLNNKGTSNSSINWEEASRAALDDIKSYDEQLKIEKDLAGPIPMVIEIILVMTLPLAFLAARGILGYIFASWIKTI